MRRCPECDTEYVDKKKTCSDCQVELIDEAEVEEIQPELDYVEMEYLTTVSSEMDANMFTSLLESYGIHAMRKYREAGGFLAVYMGESSFGIDLFADKTKIKEAKELIEPIEEESDPDESISEDEATSNNNSNLKWLKRIFLVACVLLFLL